MERTQSLGNLMWIDLEMTGLDPSVDVILQAALVVTNSRLEVLEEYSCDVWQPEAALERMVPFVRKMHERTGLVDRVRASEVDLASAQKQLLQRVTGWSPYPAVLCGNTIGQDRRFIDRYMPALAGYLHYRMLDVTSVKLLAGLWYGSGAQFAKSEVGEHDAIVDIRNSIAELQHYRKTLFKP